MGSVQPTFYPSEAEARGAKPSEVVQVLGKSFVNENLSPFFFLPAERRSKSCVGCCCCGGGGQFAGSFHLLYVHTLYFSFINYLWGGILDPPQLSSSFLLLDFGSTSSLWGGIPQKFHFNFFFLYTQMDKIHVYSAGL